MATPNDTPDIINRPAHYTGKAVECIDAIQAALGKESFIDFCRGQAMKYIWRARLKNTLEDNLLKAQWYLARALEELKK